MDGHRCGLRCCGERRNKRMGRGVGGVVDRGFGAVSAVMRLVWGGGYADDADGVQSAFCWESGVCVGGASGGTACA